MDELDVNHDGKINAQEMMKLFKNKNIRIDQVQNFINEYDLDDDGCLDKAEFLQFIKVNRRK